MINTHFCLDYFFVGQRAKQHVLWISANSKWLWILYFTEYVLGWSELRGSEFPGEAKKEPQACFWARAWDKCSVCCHQIEEGNRWKCSSEWKKCFVMKNFSCSFMCGRIHWQKINVEYIFPIFTLRFLVFFM